MSGDATFFASGQCELRVVGVPSRAGALHAGTEHAPEAVRQAGIVGRLSRSGLAVEDYGDVRSSEPFVAHNEPPVRNWPAPRSVWDELLAHARELFNPSGRTILIGGDCSVVVGAYSAFRVAYGPNTHLVVIDGHIDGMAPREDRCVGAAAMGLWFLSSGDSRWWPESAVDPATIAVVGPPDVPEHSRLFNLVSVADVSAYLATLPSDASVFVHLDVDVIHEQEMPAAYSPNPRGFSVREIAALMALLGADTRVRAMEVTEFRADKDTDGVCARRIIELCCAFALPRRH